MSQCLVHLQHLPPNIISDGQAPSIRADTPSLCYGLRSWGNRNADSSPLIDAAVASGRPRLRPAGSKPHSFLRVIPTLPDQPLAGCSGTESGSRPKIGRPSEVSLVPGRLDAARPEHGQGSTVLCSIALHV